MHFSGVIFLLAVLPNVLYAETAVTLQLPWFHQFQFAGYYAAESQGYFAEAGLNVDIRQGITAEGNNINPVEEVVFQRADFGVTRSDLLVHHARGLPVVMLATIMQRSPAAFISLEKYGIQSLEAIAERPVALPLNQNAPGDIIDIEMVAALARAGVDIDSLNNLPPDWQLDGLQDGTVQMVLGFATDEPNILRQRGYQPVVISPMDYGIDFYGDLLFTSETLLRNQPDLVAAFRQAVLKGWAYALEEPQHVANYILEQYGTRSAEYDLDFLLTEAEQMRNYIQADLIEIGYTNRKRWQRILKVYQELGVTDPVDLDRFIYTARFNVNPWWYWPLISLLLVVVLLGGYMLYRARSKQQHLQQEVRFREKRESQLRIQAETDPLTGMFNRRRFAIELEMLFIRARKEQTPLSMIMLDADYFKKINDAFGHVAGDKVLCDLAHLCQQVIRDSDVVCRFGGEEFAFLLPDSDLSEAIPIAERLITAVRNNAVVWQGQSIRYQVSIGVAELSADDAEAMHLLHRTDTQLYRAKTNGRNQICY